MASVPQPDDRFDEAEADVNHGAPWKYREDGQPNPLTILVSGWSEGVTKLGPAEFLTGTDRDGKKWSVLVGSVVLKKKLVDGLVEEWDDERQGFIVAETLGRVQVGEVVSIKFLGDRQGATYLYPDFMVARKPAVGGDAQPTLSGSGTPEEVADSDIPF